MISIGLLCLVGLAFASHRPYHPRPVQVSPPEPPIPVRQDCVVQPGPWGPCSAPCGGGRRSRQQIIVRKPTGYGAKCPDLHEETENCNPQPCPIDCIVEPGNFGPCSTTCGSGIQTKIDIIIQEAQYGGKQCPSEFELKQTVQCPSLPPCPVPVDCEVGYTQYSQCSAPCDGGFQTRSAFIKRPALNGGAPCPADLSLLIDQKPCNNEPCPAPKDCEFIEGAFGECSAKCGNGVQKAQIYIVAQPEEGGAPCPFELFKTQPCYAGPCPLPQDCQVQWEPFSYCSKECDGGSQSARGQIVRQASAGGAPCPSYSQLIVTRTCNLHPCQPPISPRDCEVAYGAYSQCSKTCGAGYRYQKGFIVKEAEFGGLACPSPAQLIKSEPCNLQPCAAPIDCQVRRGYWSECSKECGTGTQTRQLTILEYASNGGHPCPSNQIETRTCNTQPCGPGPAPINIQPAVQRPRFASPPQAILQPENRRRSYSFGTRSRF